MSNYLAFDFGASSGRAIICEYKNGTLNLEEIYRFPNEPVFLGDKYVWDFPRLFNELKNALKKVATMNKKIDGIGIDTWGVDFGLIDKNGNLIGMPMHYRDKRNYYGIKETEKYISLSELYLRNGISNNVFNTCFQLVADKKYRKEILENSDSLLFMPDLFAYYLTGEKKNEFTIASTSALLDINNKEWDYELIDKVKIPRNIFNEIINPGEIYGYLKEEVLDETGLSYNIPVIAVGGHDTASAVMGAPLKNEKDAYLSSGTWSLLGVESNVQFKTKEALKWNFTNEGGALGNVRVLKNINGLWLLQQLKKNWCEFYNDIDFPDIIREARKYENKKFIVNTNDTEFMNTKNMIKSIQKYCEESGQGIPKELGELAIAVYNGLTKEYKDTICDLENLLGYKIERINIVGGGIKDKYLSELTAKKTGKKVIAGPIEAAVIGNIIMQCIACGEISSVQEGRKIIEKSFNEEMYSV